MVLGASGLAARERTADLAWDELAPLIVERKIAVPLGGKMKVEGEALAVRPDGILIDIRKTSDAGRFPRGQGFIPRDSVTQVRMIREQGPWKLVGSILGTVGGALPAGPECCRLCC